jgi:hypothetical protein
MTEGVVVVHDWNERQCHFNVLVTTSGVLRKRVHYFSWCGTWTDSASTRGCANIPFPLLTFNTCSSRSSLATSHLMLSISFWQSVSRQPLSSLPSFSIRCSRAYMGNPPFNLVHAYMIDVCACNLYDELALRGVTYGRNSCMMKQESWFLPKLYNENFLSDGHWITHKSWVQDASKKAHSDAKQCVRSIHPKDMF